jgi:hypothetical protein
VNAGASFPEPKVARERVLHFQRKLHAHGEPDAVKVASPVRRAAARKPPADKAGTGASPPTLRAADWRQVARNVRGCGSLRRLPDLAQRGSRTISRFGGLARARAGLRMIGFGQASREDGSAARRVARAEWLGFAAQHAPGGS